MKFISFACASKYTHDMRLHTIVAVLRWQSYILPRIVLFATGSFANLTMPVQENATCASLPNGSASRR